MYKGIDLLNKDDRFRIINYFNPYGYNIESSIKYKKNTDILKMKSNTHNRGVKK